MLHYEAVPPELNALLKSLQEKSALQPFALGGGTSLALRFGHRLSIDLDLFTLEPFAPRDLFRSLDIENAIVVGESKNTLTLTSSGVKLDFLRHNYPLLEPVEIIESVPMMSLRDVAVMKLNALVNRGAKKDFFDIAELLERTTLEALLADYEAKYENTDKFTVIRSLAYFDDAESDPDPISLCKKTWNSVKDSVLAQLCEIK